MNSLRDSSDEAEARPEKRRSDELSDTEGTTESESKSDSESEYEEEAPSSQRRRNGAAGIGRRLVKRRRAGRSEVKHQRPVSRKAVSSPSTSPPERSSELEEETSSEGSKHSQTPTPTPPCNPLLKWKGLKFPQFPQVGYAFSYASGPICFLKVPTSASRSLAAHWRPPQNYAAYVIYSLHAAPDIDHKRQGLEMVNELAVHGFIGSDECEVHEEVVQDMRAVSFKKGNIVVSVAKLGDAKAFKGYWPSSEVDGEDRKTISEKLQSVMHDRALLPQPPKPTGSPNSSKCSDESTLCGTKSTSSESSSGESSSSSGREIPLEDSKLIKFVKVHWRQSKWIADNIQLIRKPRYSNVRSSTSPEDTEEEKTDFKAVVMWSNKSERKAGINLLERIIAARLGGIKNDYMRDVVRCEELMDDGEAWTTFHKNTVVVAFPGPDGEDDFIAGVEGMEHAFV